MSHKMDDGNPAFPASEAHGCNSGWPGMSLRDYFAAKAMAAIRTDNLINTQERPSDEWIEKIARAAYRQADAMIKVRGEGQPS